MRLLRRSWSPTLAAALVTVALSAAVMPASATSAGPAPAGGSIPAPVSGEPVRLDRYHDQRPQFGRCDDDALIEAGAECATVTVPLSYADPGGRTIEVAISRIATPDPATRRGILLFNPGGPGGPGLDLPALLRPVLGEVADHYDLIGFDPRFVGRSTPVTCGPTPIRDVFRSAGLDRAGFAESARLSAEFAARCHDRHGDVLPYAGTRDVARDMDIVRAALGERRISYYGVSYGTDLGAAYSQLFPGRVDRMVLDSATSGAIAEYEMARATGASVEAALDEWAAWTAARHGEYRLGRTGADVRATVTRLVDHAARTPVSIGDHRIDDNILPLVLQVLLNDQGDDPMLARTIRTLVDAAAGRPVTPSEELAALLDPLDGTAPETDAYLAASFAVLCNDDRWPTDLGTYWRNVQRSRRAQPIFGPLVNTITPCAFWEGTTTEPTPVIDNAVPILIVQAERDNNTPVAGARELHRKLTGSRLITADIRAHGLYMRRAEGREPLPCIERTINTYLTNGTLPRRDGRCPDPTG